MLQQLHYWLEKNKATATNYYDDRYWTYGTVQEYRDRDFRFWSFDTVKRTFAKLITQGYIIKGNYNKMKLDQTNWYTINYAALDKLSGKSPTESCNSPLGQNAPMEQGSLPQCNSALCPAPSVQNAPMHQGSMPQAIQEITKEINGSRLNNTDTQAQSPPMAMNKCDNPPHSQPVSGEVLTETDLLFDQFWQLYPRKENKQQARRAWAKLKPNQELFNMMANALEYRRQTKEWLAEDGRYIPHPASWLNGRRWEDEITPNQSIVLQQKYGDILVDGKPLDPVQRKQLEYIESQMRNNAVQAEVNQYA